MNAKVAELEEIRAEHSAEISDMKRKHEEALLRQREESEDMLKFFENVQKSNMQALQDELESLKSGQNVVSEEHEAAKEEALRLQAMQYEEALKLQQTNYTNEVKFLKNTIDKFQAAKAEEIAEINTAHYKVLICNQLLQKNEYL